MSTGASMDNLIPYIEHRQIQFRDLLTFAQTEGFRLLQIIPGFPDADLTERYKEDLSRVIDDYQRILNRLKAGDAQP
jgi:hypothetical protein